jgi:hypothetical protein
VWGYSLNKTECSKCSMLVGRDNQITQDSYLKESSEQLVHEKGGRIMRMASD